MADAREHAETVALRALGWLAGRPDLLEVFLGSTGASTDDLRAGAQDPDILAAVLDFLLMDDAWITDFCHTAGLPPDAPAAARAALPGGQHTHWT